MLTPTVAGQQGMFIPMFRLKCVFVAEADGQFDRDCSMRGIHPLDSWGGYSGVFPHFEH